MTATTLSDRVEILRAIPVLADLEERLLSRLAAETTTITLRSGEFLCTAGEEADAAFAIASGRLQVVDTAGSVVGELRRGDSVGELALLTGRRRSASVRASRDSTVIALGRDQFETLLHEAPAFTVALTRALASRLAQNAAPPGRRAAPRTVAVIALDRQDDVRDAATALAEALGAPLMASAPEEAAVWPVRLGELERAHSHVVLATEPGDERSGAGWRAFCLGEADLVVGITRGAPWLPWVADRGLAGGELIGIDRAVPSGLVSRLAPRIVRRVRGAGELTAAMRALARRLTGQAVGVVLSGGGARAFAHAGVLQELTRAGIRIERIGGVSLGGVVAASFARGDDSDQLLALLRRHFLTSSPTGDYTVPVVSLIRGQRTAGRLESEFRGLAIEDLRIPFFCVSADLLRREAVVHRSGPLAPALLAGLSIPGVFPPAVTADGRLLVDGGVLDNLPVGLMATPYEGPVIAVDVTHVAPATANGRRGTPLTQRVRRVVTGSPMPLPTLPETIVRCMTLGAADSVAAARRHADVVITPDVSGIGMLDWRRLDEMREAGARAARHTLESQPGLLTS